MRSQREPIFRWIRFARHRISAAKRSISNRSHGSFVSSSHSICTRKAFVTIRQKIWHRARRIIHLIKLRWVSSNGSKIRRVDLQSELYAEEQKSRKVRKTSYDTWKWGCTRTYIHRLLICLPVENFRFSLFAGKMVLSNTWSED